MKPVLAVAAHSARVLAECAAADGFDVIALDLFGDLDTRRACVQWIPLGRPGRLQLDRALTLQALAALAARGDVLGWVAGSGFEGLPDLLAEGDDLLPLWGTPPEAVRGLREPRKFFETLDALGVDHPETRFTAPAQAAGWLRKDGHGTGGWHITRAGRAGKASPSATSYFQRELPGRPMSATVLASEREVQVLGFNELLVQVQGNKPFVYGGVIGPVGLDAACASRLRHWAEAMVARFGVRGLCSIDFLLAGSRIDVLEINPRPPASMALYTASRAEGLITAHLRACGAPVPLHCKPISTSTSTSTRVRGTRVVYARRRSEIPAAAVRRLHDWPDAHDLPAGPCTLAAGDPLCSVDAAGADAPSVMHALQQSELALWAALETST